MPPPGNTYRYASVQQSKQVLAYQAPLMHIPYLEGLFPLAVRPLDTGGRGSIWFLQATETLCKFFHLMQNVLGCLGLHVEPWPAR